ncbi:class II glutamine amidotransferase [Rhodococcus ruber]|uniref:class II glutamine amidotransferase n=1 Tax=Rhodococcus TaxID=1827 RepID=UPI000C7E6B99|nr:MULTISPECIES: class II glutamine amidotransferase [Rhodococcus]AUM19102.1 class II glutamine amidotransferase [Rhodococcus ruber]MBD8055105.1 class II glutamine amidotransferase [Rhodococcus ruber]MCF8784802.1 class II glutamine amidotransferase [Rhodococcus ruber]MDV3207971.1 class II glutamine amidotransferase [Rhodococcus ruber]QDC16863.1 class II glutamine amidotransferase [Rhodococcus ruber]
MCRLFGLTAAPHRVHATFWLLDASDSLARQSRREPDGTGLGTFADDGRPVVEKQPLAAYEDRAFATEAKERRSQTFVAHIRFASTGGLDVGNTHPFEQRGRLFAHNGVLGDLPRLEAELGPYRDLVAGETDSERFFALVTRRIDEHGGDVGAGLTAAVRWAAGNLPVYALNVVLTTATELWALRYPDTHDLFVLERPAGGPHGGRHLEHASEAGTVRVRSGHLARQPAVVVASERMDEDPGWSDLRCGELLHVDGELRVTRTVVVDEPPRHPITLADLDERAAASQTGK